MARRGEIDWEAAFQHYAGLPPGQRTFGKVASTFGVSDRSVGVRARRDSWQPRVAALDTEARRRAEERTVRSLQARMEDAIRVSELVRGQFVQQLREGTVRLSASDVVAFARLELLVAGEPDSRVEMGVRALVDELSTMSSGELWAELAEMRAADDALEETERTLPPRMLGPISQLEEEPEGDG